MSENGSLQNEIVGLLNRIPKTWGTFELDQLTDAEASALVLLVAAGMVERRFELRLRMINHPLAMTAQATATGESGVAKALSQLVAGLWHEWRESYEQWRQSDTCDSVPFVCERIGKDEWRLTKEGVLALGDLSSGSASTVFDFVLKRGFFTCRFPYLGSGRLLTFDRVPADSLTSNNWHSGPSGELRRVGQGGVSRVRACFATAEIVRHDIVGIRFAVRARQRADHQRDACRVHRTAKATLLIGLWKTPYRRTKAPSTASKPCSAPPRSRDTGFVTGRRSWSERRRRGTADNN